MRNEDCKGKGGARTSLANTVHVLSWRLVREIALQTLESSRVANRRQSKQKNKLSGKTK